MEKAPEILLLHYICQSIPFGHIYEGIHCRGVSKHSAGIVVKRCSVILIVKRSCSALISAEILGGIRIRIW